jgi:tRNA dimethylallyltransferase
VFLVKKQYKKTMKNIKVFPWKILWSELEKFTRQPTNKIIEILGATASGKSRLAVEIALKLKRENNITAEIISVDSKQIYQDCDISSAKISVEEMQGIVHHGLNICTLDKEFNAYLFQQYAFEIIRKIQNRGHLPILCGGTMMWLDAISEDYQFGWWQRIWRKISPKKFSGGKFSWEFFKIGINWERAKIYQRCDERAVWQFENGIIEETEKVLQKYPNITKSAFTSFGYQEIKQFLAGEISQEKALKTNQQRNRNYVKKQLTWWRGRNDVHLVDGNQTRTDTYHPKL